jgi:integrase
MGAHKGFRIRPDGDRYRAEVRDPKAKSYRSKTFDTIPEAKAWARSEAGLMASGTASVTPKGRLLTAGVVRDYLADLKALKRSPSHLANITATMGDLQAAVPDLLDPTAGSAIERWLNGQEIAPATRNRKLSEVRTLIHWCQVRDLLVKDPSRAIRQATVPKKMKPHFTLDELRTLLMHQHAYRKRFTLMVYAGLRAEEAAALTWGDMDLSGMVLLVRFHEGYRLKRGRERIVPLQDELLALLGDPGDPKTRVAPIHRVNEREAFSDFLDGTGIEAKGRSPHSCRHTYAGLMTASGVPGPLLSAYLGHTSAATTMVYTGLASRYVHATEHWGRGRIRVCEGMVSKWKTPSRVARGS